MSRPQAWNGTAWVDPAFHVGGGVYKSYIAQVYDRRPLASPDFATGLEGWTRNSGTPGSEITWNPGGFMTMTGPGGFLQDYGAKSPRESLAIQAWNGRRVRLEARYNSDTNNTVMGWTFFMYNYGGPEIDLFPPNAPLIGDSQWHDVSSEVQVLQLNYPDPYEVYCNVLLYGGGTCHVDYTRLVDADTGQILLALGDPGWEPKVYRGNGVWK